MRLQRIQIKNFRSFEDFDLVLDGASVTVVAPNAGGKTTLLTAIAAALSGGRGFTRRDFRDLEAPIEIIATLRDLAADDQAAFADVVQFGGGTPTLDIGIRAIWDDDADLLDLTWGFPESGWSRVGRDARDRLALIWLPADRDPGRWLALAGSRSVLGVLLDSFALEQPLDTAIQAVGAAMSNLVADPTMAQLLGQLDTGLDDLIPDVVPGAFDIEAASTTPRELLQQFDLALSHTGPHIPVTRQSSGLAQLAIFVVALQVAAHTPTIVLVDEPEASLHPQAQRSLAAAIRSHAAQSIVATHSSSVVSSADPREVVRLKRDGNDVIAKRPTGLTQADAIKLARYATPETAEAFFARTVIFVEGPSDYLAMREAAQVLGVNLDARGVAVVSLQGAGLLATYLGLLGPAGLDMSLLGLCDLDAEQDWQTKLTAAGIAATDRPTMNASGFFVCDVDLEAELVRAHGVASVQALIASDGETARFNAFVSEPAIQGLPAEEQLARFARKRKTLWAPRLVGALADTALPSPIRDVLDRV